jgi:hypothetical protein
MLSKQINQIFMSSNCMILEITLKFMKCPCGMCRAVTSFLENRLDAQAQDLVSLVIFDSSAKIVCETEDIRTFHTNLSSRLVCTGGGTSFITGLEKASEVHYSQYSLEFLCKRTCQVCCYMAMHADFRERENDLYYTSFETINHHR